MFVRLPPVVVKVQLTEETAQYIKPSLKTSRTECALMSHIETKPHPFSIKTFKKVVEFLGTFLKDVLKHQPGSKFM